MHFVFLLDAAQDGNGVLLARFLDQDRLKASFQGGVLFNIFPVFVQGGCADAVQFAPGQGRFEHIGGIHGAFGGTGADQGVDLVDKEDDLAGPFFNFLENGLQAVLKLAPVLCSCDQGAEVQGNDLLAFQGGRDIAVDDPLGQPLDNGGFADPGFADENGIVFGPSREHLDDPADFLVAADDRIKFSLAGDIGQVAGIFFQGLVFFLGIGIGYPLAAADSRQGLEKGVVGNPLPGQHGGDFQ